MIMPVTRQSRAVAAALAILLAASPVGAQEGGEEQQNSDPETLAREGAERLMRALEGILQIIPQYGMPRIEEDGDIVIPRLNPPEQEDQQDAPDKEGDEPAPQTEI
jgi:hypothetical protein